MGYTINFTTKQGQEAMKSINIVKGLTFVEVRDIAMEKAQSCADCYTFTIWDGKKASHYSALGKWIS